MAPHVEDGHVPEIVPTNSKVKDNGNTEAATNGHSQTANSSTEPLQLKGVLDQFKSFDVTPVIGREFRDGQLADWLRAPNSDELLRDLAITSQSI